MDLSLEKLPWYAQIGLFVALTLVGVGVFYWYYELDVRAGMDTRNLQLDALRGEIARGRQTAAKLPEFRAQIGDLESRLASLREVLPEEEDAADLLRRMQTVAVQSNLKIRGFKPAPVVTKQLHAEWPITLELEGTYHNLAVFLDRVGKFTRIVNVTELQIRGKDKPEPNASISATCVATTYVLLDRTKPATAPGKGENTNAAAKTAA